MVRYLMIVLCAGGVLLPLAACESPEPTAGPGSPSPSVSSAAPASPPSSPGTSSPGPSAAGPSSRSPSEPESSARPPSASPAAPGGPGEVPGELPHGERTLTGVVEQAGDCTMLRVGARLWGLSGTPADGLSHGDRVTVVGQVTTTTGCAGEDVARTLIVQRIKP